MLITVSIAGEADFPIVVDCLAFFGKLAQIPLTGGQALGTVM
jgi:hypothetical protein